MFFNNTKLSELNFPQILAPVEEALFLEDARQIFSKYTFLDKSEQIEEYFQKIEQTIINLKDIRATFREVSFAGIPKLNKKEHLYVKDLNQILLVLELSQDLNDYYSFSEIPTDLQKVSQEIRNIIDKDANILYDNHPKLSGLRKSFLKTDEIIREHLTKLISTLKEHLQIPTFDLIDNKYLLPIKSDHYRSSLGPIVYRSGSGHTLWVAPKQLDSLVSKRMFFINKEEEILTQLTLQFSNRLHSHFHTFSSLMDGLIELDILQAKALFISSRQLIKPSFGEELFLENLYHPLIKNPIKNTIKISKDLSGIIISGPNAGGKTILLKSVVISYLFTHLGIFVPATKAVLLPIKNLYFIGNKNQDINMGLSSFTAEASEYLSIIRDAQGGLVIIDEIFNSTASDEASHLALSIFNKLINYKLIVSTHHKLLKDLLTYDQRFLSFHMHFDLEHHSPTYKLKSGPSESSFAIPTFKHLLKVWDLADDFLITDTKLDHHENLRQEIENLKQTIGEQNKTIRENTDRFNSEKKEMISIFQKKLDELADISPGIKRIKKKDKILRELPSVIDIPAVKIILGENYFSKTLNSVVTVLKVETSRVIIRKGNMTFPIDINDLEFISKPKKHVKIDVDPIELELHLDYRGMRLSEFQEEVIKILDNLAASSNEYVEIVHGFGVLRDWLLGHLQKQNHSFANENSGMTRIYKV